MDVVDQVWRINSEDEDDLSNGLDVVCERKEGSKSWMIPSFLALVPK